GEVPARQKLRERGRVRAGDLHLALDGDVPERRVLEEMPVLLLVVVVERRDQHVVVEIPARAAGLDRPLPVRRLPVPGRGVERERVRLPHVLNDPFLFRRLERSFWICLTALYAGIPHTPPPACVAELHRYSPR